MAHFLAYAATFTASICFGLASVLEQKATLTNAPLSGLNLRNFTRLVRNAYYLGGLGLDAVGFICMAIAVRALPLFFVQAVDSASIVVTVVAARVLLGVSTRARDYRCIAVVLAGLLLLCFASGTEASRAVSDSVRHWLLYASAVTVVMGAALSKPLAHHPHLTAFISGLCFSMLVVLTRIIDLSGPWLHVVTNPLALLLAANGILGIMLFSMALQVGSVTYVYSITFVTETILPTMLGLALLHDAPLHHRWALMITGLAVTITGITALLSGKNNLHHA